MAQQQAGTLEGLEAEFARQLRVVEDGLGHKMVVMRGVSGRLELVRFLEEGDGEERTSGQRTQVRDDQVRNHEGGYVFPVSEEQRVLRFLILGTSGGTFYQSEKQLTMDNIKALTKIIDNGNGSMIVKLIEEVSVAGRNPKQDPVMFALALCARYRVHDTMKSAKSSEDEVMKKYSTYIRQLHKKAFEIMPRVCRIPTHLFAFIRYCELVSKETSPTGKSTGWGRQMREAVSSWYEKQPCEKLAMQLTKYVQREGWSNRDLFRLAHPKAAKAPGGADSAELLEKEQLFRFAVKGDLATRKRRLTEAEAAVEQPAEKYSAEQMDKEEASKALDLVEAFLKLKGEATEAQCVEYIEKFGLVREHIPTGQLNSPLVWKALLQKMPMTAMIRNLGKMQSIGILDEEKERALLIAKLTSEEELKKARVHPIQVLLASSVYSQGGGVRGSLKWEPNEQVKAALEVAFVKAFVNTEPTGKRICLAFDVSGSMMCQISNTCLSARYASAALGQVFQRNEPHVEQCGFSHYFMPLPYTADWTLDKISEHMDEIEFGATDCALPMLWAIKEKKQFDVFIVYTDCETYFGDVHPFEALKQYREASGIDAKLVVCGMTATDFTIADPSDAGMLDVVGFDSSVPQLIHEFIQGKL